MTLQVEVERIEIGEPENLGNMALCDINYLFFFCGLGVGGGAAVGWRCEWLGVGLVLGYSRKRQISERQRSTVVGPSSFKISCPEWSIGDNGCSLWLLTPCYRFKLSWIYYFTGFV